MDERPSPQGTYFIDLVDSKTIHDLSAAREQEAPKEWMHSFPCQSESHKPLVESASRSGGEDTGASAGNVRLHTNFPSEDCGMCGQEINGNVEFWVRNSTAMITQSNLEKRGKY